MDRAWKSGASATPPVHTDNTAGNYPTAGNPGTGVPATKPGPFWFHMITEELRAVLVAAGVTPDKSDTDQLLDALKAIGLLGGASGGGIGQLKFPSAQNASADANTLDDYEEGNWTPVLTGSGGSPAHTYTTQAGRYTKVGNIVLLNGTVVLSAKGGAITGSVQISGLPFATDAGLAWAVAIPRWNALGTNWMAIGGYVAATLSVIQVQGRQSAGSGQTDLVDADIAATTQLTFSASYRAA